MMARPKAMNKPLQIWTLARLLISSADLRIHDPLPFRRGFDPLRPTQERRHSFSTGLASILNWRAFWVASLLYDN